MTPVFQLLTELSIDPFRLDDFMRDPDALIASRGIGSQDVPSALRAAGLAPGGSWARAVAMFDPGHDPLPDPDVPESPEQDRT